MDFVEGTLGRSIEGRPISFLRRGQGPAYTYLIAGTHGDEVESVFVMHQLIAWLGQTQSSPLIIVPVLNPDGLARGSRTNARGVDLNRNLPTRCWCPTPAHSRYAAGTAPLSEPENQGLTDLFAQYPVKQVLSFHSWKPMLQCNGDIAPIAHFLSRFNGYPVVGEVIEGHPTPGSLGHYVPEAHGAPVLTIELPEIIGAVRHLEDIWLENAPGLQALFNQSLL